MAETRAIKITDTDGKEHTLLMDHLTALDVKALRAQTGWGLRGLARMMSEDPDLDALAAVMWLARRQDGERDLTYEQVAEGLSLVTMPEVDIEGDAALELDSPET